MTPLARPSIAVDTDIERRRRLEGPPAGEIDTSAFQAERRIEREAVEQRKAEARRAGLLSKLRSLPNQGEFTSASLLEADFPEPAFFVERLITEGYTLFAGPTKAGKSWMILHFGLAVSSGGRALGQLFVEQTAVLYISLEDTPRRLQDRLRKLNAEPSFDFHFFTKWLRAEEGVEALDAYLVEHPEIRVVFIDTLGRFFLLDDGNSYEETSRAGARLKTVADDHGVAIVGVHHSGKTPRSDWIAGVLGSTGYSAVADSIFVLGRQRGRADAVLQVTGRDLLDEEIALSFDPDIQTWSIMGEAADARRSEQRQAVLEYVRKHGPIRTHEVAEGLRKSDTAVSYLLGELKDEGVVVSPRYGLYAVDTAQSPQSTQSSNNEGGSTSRTSRTLRDSDGRHTW